MKSAFLLSIVVLHLLFTPCRCEITRRPKPLRQGDTIAFVAPARPPARTAMMVAKTRLEEMGFQVLIPPNFFRQHGYLAGTDQQRADEIMSAFTNENVDAIFCATGGFGTTRMLNLLDFEAIRANPKIFTGFSDITGLHLAINKATGLITFHAPNVDTGLGTEKNLNVFSNHWFWKAIHVKENETSRPYSITPFHFMLETGDRFQSKSFSDVCDLPTPGRFGKQATAEGRIVGGNLSLVVALMGTPYEIETKGNILFLEDIGEAPYRVDRMLSTLKLAGKLDDMHGAILGTFTDRADQDRSNEGQSLHEVLASYFANQAKPVIYGFPAGHHKCNATIPIGVRCRIDTSTHSIQLLESPTLP